MDKREKGMRKKSKIDKIMLILLNLSQRTLDHHLLVIATNVFLQLIALIDQYQLANDNLKNLSEFT